MNIIFFTENTQCGGLDSFFITLVNNWPNSSDKLSIICNHNHPGLRTIEKSLNRQCQIITHKLPVYSVLVNRNKVLLNTNIIERILLFFLKYSLFIYYLIALPKLLFVQRADRLMVVNGGYPGGDTCRAAVIVWSLFKRQTRAVFNFHNLAVVPKRYIRYVEYIIDWLVGYSSKCLITVSNASAQSMQRRPFIVRTKKIFYIYNGIDDSRGSFINSNRSLKDELNLPSMSKICLMLGAYELRKGHVFLLNSFKKVVDNMPLAYLIMCGHGRPEEIKTVNKIVDKLSLEKNVYIFNFRNDVSYLLRNVDVLVVPSQDFESFGLTCVEAMRHKVPVVATNVGGLPEVIIDGEGGYCLPPDDIDGYAFKIQTFLEDEVLRKEQGEKGYRRYKELFTGKRMASEYARIIYQNN